MKSKTPELTIIILSYNVEKLLDACLASLYQDSHSSQWQIIVVDNASTDKSVAMTKKKYPKVHVIASDKNLGFSAGNNLAVSSIKAPFTLFLNPDTEVPIGTIPTIMHHLQRDIEIGAATCRVNLPSGQLDDGCHRGFPSPWNSFCHFSKLSKLLPFPPFTGYSLSHLDLTTPHEIDSLTGAFMMLPTEVGEQLNWWDEDYFWNGEDLDFCFRINQAGYKVMYYPEVTITHFKGSSGGYKKDSHGKRTVNPETKLLAAKSSTQAMRIFYHKHYESHYPALINKIIYFGIDQLEIKRINAVLET